MPQALLARDLVFLDVELRPPATAGGPGEPPKEFRIFPQGKHSTDKGDYVFNAKSAKSVMAEYSKRGNRVPFDYCHGMLDDSPLDPELSGKAAGTCELEVRNGELWAVNCDWTPDAVGHFQAKRYRQFSPAFLHLDGVITRLINVALTNIPATFDQVPLVASRELNPQENRMKTVLVRLGLAEDASEAEATDAVAKLQADRKELQTLTGKSSFAEAQGVIEGWKSAAELGTKATAELAALKVELAEKRVLRVVRLAIKQGALPPAMKKKAMVLGRKSPELLEGFLETFHGLTKGKKVPKEPDQDEATVAVQLTASDKKAIALSGIDPKEFAKAKLAGIKRLELDGE